MYRMQGSADDAVHRFTGCAEEQTGSDAALKVGCNVSCSPVDANQTTRRMMVGDTYTSLFERNRQP